MTMSGQGHSNNNNHASKEYEDYNDETNNQNSTSRTTSFSAVSSSHSSHTSNNNSHMPRNHSMINFKELSDALSDDDDDDDDKHGPPPRLVAVRYFLDRPNYGLHNSAVRLWFDPPAICTANDVSNFLKEQNIAMPGLLVEVYLDQFESFMMLEACQANFVNWDFTDTTSDCPGRLNIRLTDLEEAHQEECITEWQKQAKCYNLSKPTSASTATPPQTLANVTPSGLFSFSIMVGLETASLLIDLVPNSVNANFYLSWGPYMFFVGGLMQILVAIFQVVRNNVYGATAFFGFGCFWFANGTILILKTYGASIDTPAYDLLSLSDPWGDLIRVMFIFAFCCALLVQTFAMNRLSSTLIGLLCAKVFFQAFAGLSTGVKWTQFIFGCLTSVFAFYVFLVEFTNQVYQREVFRVFKWSEEHSPEEVFGAAGRLGTLHSKAARLRQAHYPNPRKLRSATADKSESKKTN